MHIKNLSIENYKSVRKLKLNPKRVNVFIGEPNSGKTNIIEAMSFLGMSMTNNYNFREVIRFDTIDELFPDSDTSQPIKVITDELKYTLEFHRNEHGAVMNNFLATYLSGKNKNAITSKYILTYEGSINQTAEAKQFFNNIAFYSFKKHKTYQHDYRDILSPPFGDNIPNLLLSQKALRSLVSSIFKDKGFRLEIKPKETKMTIVKEDKDGTLYSYPYSSVSETLQRIVFMLLAIESNKDFTLIFDEPEANTFPFYTKYIAERIALDKSNQYFFTTHNPYLLMSVIEKTSAKELNVVVTRMENYETKSYPLNQKQIESAIKMGHDMFFNLDKLVKK